MAKSDMTTRCHHVATHHDPYVMNEFFLEGCELLRIFSSSHCFFPFFAADASVVVLGEDPLERAGLRGLGGG